MTSRTARFLRPATPVEKVFRDAAWAWRGSRSRGSSSTPAAWPSPIPTRSSACERSGGQSVQNVAFEWPDGSPGRVNDLLRWADGRLLVLVFGAASPPRCSASAA